jgi:outer membrane protein assembly factor BamA
MYGKHVKKTRQRIDHFFPGLKGIVLAMCWFMTAGIYARGDHDSIVKPGGCEPKEIQEILLKKEPRPPDTARKTNAFVLPYVAYNPTKGFQLGAGGTLTWYFGRSRSTKQSAASFGAEFTSKDQKLFQFKSNVYTNRNRWFLQGDWRYYVYSLPTYGLGTGRNNPVPEVPGVSSDALPDYGWEQEFPIKYYWLRIHEVFSYRLVEDLYAGLGIHFDLHYRIEDENLDLDSANPVLTPHYAYSSLHGFSTEEYRTSNLSINFVYDTRDNLICPYKGYYVNLNYRLNQRWLGSDAPGSQLWMEFRTYFNLERKFPRHLIALWLFGGFQVSGQIPFLDLWSTGFDQMNSSGRGYLQGRWRGENLVYGEAEYRFPISRCSQVLGGVLFVNASTASGKDQNIPLFGYIRPAGGIGLRIMVDKVNRTNIRIDFTIGEKSSGIYFSAQEAF